MKNYQSKAAAIVGMHERGFTNDFQLFGDKLLWIQEKIFISQAFFAIIEYHSFHRSANQRSPEILFGIELNHYNIKGILTNDYACYTLTTPAVIAKKLYQLNTARVHC